MEAYFPSQVSIYVAFLSLQRFPHMFPIESQLNSSHDNDSSHDIFLKDWYNSFKNTFIATTQFKSIVMDIGESRVKARDFFM